MFTVKDKDLRGPDGEARSRELIEATRAKPNGELKDLEERIRKFEEVFGFSSDEMQARLRNKSLEESEPVSRWLLLLDLKRRVEHVVAKAR